MGNLLIKLFAYVIISVKSFEKSIKYFLEIGTYGEESSFDVYFEKTSYGITDIEIIEQLELTHWIRGF